MKRILAALGGIVVVGLAGVGIWLWHPVGGQPPAATLASAAANYDAEIIRMGPETKLAPARRKVMVQKFARHAAVRAQAAQDPGFVNLRG